MSQHSQDRLSAPLEQYSRSARILPFERPQSELQKAVQLRAQESLELTRQRENHKPPIWRSIVAIALAVVPVVVVIIGLDGFLRVFHRINEIYAAMPDNRPVPAAEPVQSEPGVVMLRPIDPVSRADKPATPPAALETKK